MILNSTLNSSAEDVMLYPGTEVKFLPLRYMQFIWGTASLSKETASRLFHSILICPPMLWGWITLYMLLYIMRMDNIIRSSKICKAYELRLLCLMLITTWGNNPFLSALLVEPFNIHILAVFFELNAVLGWNLEFTKIDEMCNLLQS